MCPHIIENVIIVSKWAILDQCVIIYTNDGIYSTQIPFQLCLNNLPLNLKKRRKIHAKSCFTKISENLVSICVADNKVTDALLDSGSLI